MGAMQTKVLAEMKRLAEERGLTLDIEFGYANTGSYAVRKGFDTFFRGNFNFQPSSFDLRIVDKEYYVKHVDDKAVKNAVSDFQDAIAEHGRPFDAAPGPSRTCVHHVDLATFCQYCGPVIDPRSRVLEQPKKPDYAHVVARLENLCNFVANMANSMPLQKTKRNRDGVMEDMLLESKDARCTVLLALNGKE